jgi:hypothetical protein
MRYAILMLVLAGLSVTAEAKWVLVIDGAVTETWASRPKFHRDIMERIYPAPDEVAPGWRLVSGTWLPPKTEAENAQEAFDRDRAQLLSMPARKAAAAMGQTWKYKLTGSLTNSYPDLSQPLCVTEEGEHLTLVEFMEYIQERDDDGAANPELQALKQTAKQVRKYFRNLRGK